MNSKTSGKFLCVLPPKTLQIDHDTGETHRPLDSERHVREALEAIDESNNLDADDDGSVGGVAAAAAATRETSTSSKKELSGGGIAISVGPNVQAFTDNEIIVSFVGHLTNVDYLAWRLFHPDGRRGEDLKSSPLEAAKTLVGGRCYEAELICHVYRHFGVQCLPKLRGEYAFACYDARTVRVFAARDASGKFQLKFGRGIDGTVVVSNFDGASELLPKHSRSDGSAMASGSEVEFEDVPPGT